MRTSILLPEGERLASGSTFRQAVAISPDGRWVAYASYKPGEGDEPDGDPVINLRRLDQTEVRRIPGFNPFFSPDSQQLGFVALVEPEGYLLKRTVVEGVTNETVASLEMAPFGCDWLPDDTIIFSPGVQTGLFAIPAVGGEPRALTRLDEEASEFSHRLPSVLPDGRSILYTALRFNNHSWNQARIVAERLDTGGKKVLIEGGSDGRYVASGHLLFAREGSLMAIQLDADHLEIRGEAVPVLDGVVHAIHSNNSVNETSAAQYGTSLGGLLIYAPGSVYPERSVELVWVDGRGREKTIELPDGNWSGPKISPDGEEVSLVRNYPPKELWIYGVERRTLRRQTVDGSAGKVIWGPEEGCLTLNWDPEGPEGIWVKTIDSGSERGEEIVSSNAEGIPAVGSWSPHGRRLAFSMWFAPDAGGPGDTDIWILDRQGRAEPWLQTRFREYQPEFSPDGRWLAYTSDESGRREVYVRPFPGLGRPLQVSTESGTEPSWSRDGAEIFYVQIPSSETTTFKAVKVRVDSKNGELRLGAPRTLFSGPFSWGGLPSRSNYDVGPDGRFLVRKPDQKGFRPRLLEALAPNRIELVQNWFEELSKKVPTE
jgi:Tol biopolymer transport system component